MTRQLAVLALLTFVLAGCGSRPGAERFAPLLDGMSNFHHAVSTQDPLAQRFFDQGMVLAFGFNHAEAERSFRQAASLDSTCAMCLWGAAYVLGPNINSLMEDEAVSPAYEALMRGMQLLDHATDQEAAYIEALAARYVPEPVDDRSALDQAYARAMASLVERYPDDMDAATLYAEALMVTTPWDYWLPDGEPRDVTKVILRTLERVLEHDPNHPGANHLYIHAVEAVHPEEGVAAADRLRDLVPGAGHLVHMPAHIYIRVGRYHDGSEANERAIASDMEYETQCHAQGIYPIAYVPHNYHFLWATTTMEGRGEDALDAARKMSGRIDSALMREPGYGTLQHYWITPLYGLVRFGKWDEILSTPAPPADLLYPNGVWHYARGIAYSRMGDLDNAREELAAIRTIAVDSTLERVTIWDINTTAHLLRIATETLAGEVAAAGADFAVAEAHLRGAVALEDALNYDEPPPWHQPTRQVLGAVLMEAGKPSAAEVIYREDLARYPENGWSLKGLQQALAAQEKEDEAGAVQARFETAWQYADAELTASRL